MKTKILKKAAVLGLCGVLPLMLTGCMTAVVGAASGTAGVMVGSDSRTINTMFYDETIEQDGSKILYSNKLLSDKEKFKVSIISMSGNVLLVGQTVNQDYLNWCINQIRNVNYVREVYNYVTPQLPVSAGTQANDAYITSKVKSKLLFGEKINSGRFKVVTENGEVFLMGFVNPDEAKRAVNITTQIEGVTKVYTIFDYMTNEAQLTKKQQSSENFEVRRVDAGGSSSTPVYSAPQSSGSTYITPIDNSANGGAAIVDDGSSGLLAPAQPLEIY